MNGPATTRMLKGIRRIMLGLMETLARELAPKAQPLDGGLLVAHPAGGLMRRDWIKTAAAEVKDIAARLLRVEKAMEALERVRKWGWEARILSDDEVDEFKVYVHEYGVAIDEVFPDHITSRFTPVWKRHFLDHWADIMPHLRQ